MSRTSAHTPFHVRARNAKDTVEVHKGCHLDPSGAERFVRWETVEVPEEAKWRPKSYMAPDPFFSKRYEYNFETQRYELPLGPSRAAASYFDHHAAPGSSGECIYVPLIRTERVPVYEVVACDIDNPMSRYGGCHYNTHQALIDTYGYRHKCHWGGMRRDLWYKPERQQAREFCREAAAAYNTHGEAPEDEPYTPGSPSGLWGGGWVD